MDILIEKFAQRHKIKSQILELKKTIDQKKLEKHLKKLIDSRDIDAALNMYKEIQLPGINTFLLDELKKSIQFKNFERIHKIITNSKESTVYSEIKEIVYNFMINEYSLIDISIDQFIIVMNKHGKYIDFFDIFKEIVDDKRSKFMKMELRDVLEIDRWLETYGKMVSSGIICSKKYVQEYVDYEMMYVRLVKEKRLIQNEEEKKYFVERVERRWRRFGSEAYRSDLKDLFVNIISNK